MILGILISFFYGYLLSFYPSFKTQVRYELFGDIPFNPSQYSSMFLLLFCLWFNCNLNISPVYFPCDVCHPSTKHMAGVSHIMSVCRTALKQTPMDMPYHSNVEILKINAIILQISTVCTKEEVVKNLIL